MGSGWIYALNNAGNPGLLKIGMTENSPVDRVNNLNGTGVVYPFAIVHMERVSNARAAERFLHDFFNKQRENPKREFFRVTAEHAILAMKEAVKRYPVVNGPSNKNDALAQASLGIRFLDGRGVPQSDTEAARLLELASNKGVVSAHIILANLYSKGIGVEKSDFKAAQLLERAAFAGDSKAQYLLGLVYELGKGRPQSYKIARNLYKTSGDQGNFNGRCAYGRFLLEGLGGLKDEFDAYLIFKLCAEDGHAESQALLDSMLSRGYRPKW